MLGHPAGEHVVDLAHQVVDVLESGVHALGADGGVDVRGVAGQEDPAAGKGIGDAVMHPVPGEPLGIGVEDAELPAQGGAGLLLIHLDGIGPRGFRLAHDAQQPAALPALRIGAHGEPEHEVFLGEAHVDARSQARHAVGIKHVEHLVGRRALKADAQGLADSGGRAVGGNHVARGNHERPLGAGAPDLDALAGLLQRVESVVPQHLVPGCLERVGQDFLVGALLQHGQAGVPFWEYPRRLSLMLLKLRAPMPGRSSPVGMARRRTSSTSPSWR